MASETPREFVKENWQEIAIGSAAGMMLGILAVVATRKALDHLNDDVEQGPEVDTPDDGS